MCSHTMGGESLINCISIVSGGMSFEKPPNRNDVEVINTPFVDPKICFVLGERGLERFAESGKLGRGRERVGNRNNRMFCFTKRLIVIVTEKEIIRRFRGNNFGRRRLVCVDVELVKSFQVKEKFTMDFGSRECF